MPFRPWAHGPAPLHQPLLRHCTGDLLRLLKVSKSSTAQSVTVEPRRRLLKRRQRQPNQHPQACKVGRFLFHDRLRATIVKTRTGRCSVASRPTGRTKELQSVQLERVLRIVASPGVFDSDEGIQGRNVVVCTPAQRCQSGGRRRHHLQRCVLCSSSRLGSTPTLLRRTSRISSPTHKLKS